MKEKTFRFTSNRYPRSGAFTIFELLCGIVIIAILIVLITASVKSVVEGARRSQCVSNLRQIGVASLMYASEHKGVLPLPYSINYPYAARIGGYPGFPENQGLASIIPYIQTGDDAEDAAKSTAMKVFFCPSGKNRFERDWLGFAVRSTGYNQYCGFDVEPISQGSQFVNSRSTVLQSSDVSRLLFIDLACGNNPAFTNHKKSDGSAAGANALFVDGSVSWIGADKLSFTVHGAGLEYRFPDPFAKN